MAAYKQAVIDLIKPLDHPVILVGHSMNGALISHVAEQIPEKIERLIYVTAFLLKDGGSVLEAMVTREFDCLFIPCLGRITNVGRRFTDSAEKRSYRHSN